MEPACGIQARDSDQERRRSVGLTGSTRSHLRVIAAYERVNASTSFFMRRGTDCSR